VTDSTRRSRAAPRMRIRVVLLALAGAGLVALAAWHYRPQLIDLKYGTTPAASEAQLTEALARGAVILDVRMYVETRKDGADLIPGALNIPLQRLTGQLESLPRDKPIIAFCVTGKRAGKAADVLRARGFEALSGGGIANVRQVLRHIEESKR
jgi:phage shock protein E